MPGRGPARNPDRSQVRRRNIEPPNTVVIADGQKHGPELPNTFEWPQATLDWWDTWRASPQAAMFTKTDWSFMLDTAVLHGEFWSGNRSLAAELRLRVAKFGATPEDRARLRIEVGDGAKPPPSARLQPRSAQQREARLLKAVGDTDG
jgi:hypothetical protein